jgi:hypothetical protein
MQTGFIYGERKLFSHPNSMDVPEWWEPPDLSAGW